MLQHWCVLSRMLLFLKWTRRKNQEGSNLLTMEAIISSSRTLESDTPGLGFVRSVRRRTILLKCEHLISEMLLHFNKSRSQNALDG